MQKGGGGCVQLWVQSTSWAKRDWGSRPQDPPPPPVPLLVRLYQYVVRRERVANADGIDTVVSIITLLYPAIYLKHIL